MNLFMDETFVENYKKQETPQKYTNLLQIIFRRKKNEEP